MQGILNHTGSIAGITGALLCAISGLTRIFGNFYLAGYESTTLFSVGTGLMVFACLMKLETILATGTKP